MLYAFTFLNGFLENITSAETLFSPLVTGGGQPGKQLFSFLHILI